jgi:primase-polymerase (primpol)-like protein
MPIIAENISDELVQFDQWVGWRFEQHPGEPKARKVPYQCNGSKADKTNPRHQTSFANVYEVYSTGLWLGRKVEFTGVGFCFMPGDPFLGVDLDRVWQNDADEGAPFGLQILEHFLNTYFEESPSGCGLKVWCRGTMPEGRGRNWKVASGAVEMASQGKYFTVTSRSGPARVILDKQRECMELIRYLDEDGGVVKPASGIVSGKIPHGTQHNTLVRIAGSLRAKGVCDDAVEACLQTINREQCEKPGPPANITRIVRSTSKWRK